MGQGFLRKCRLKVTFLAHVLRQPLHFLLGSADRQSDLPRVQSHMSFLNTLSNQRLQCCRVQARPTDIIKRAKREELRPCSPNNALAATTEGWV